MTIYHYIDNICNIRFKKLEDYNSHIRNKLHIIRRLRIDIDRTFQIVEEKVLQEQLGEKLIVIN